MESQTVIRGFFAAASVVAVFGFSEISFGAQVLTDSKGNTVYTYDLDQGMTSKCYNTCARTWPPVQNLGQNGPDVSKTVRTDGRDQSTFQGRPLYYYVGDSAPGDRNGDGLDGIWHVINE